MVAHGARRRRDRGAAAVEAALVLPLLLMLVFGMIDFGRMLNAQLRVTEGAREAARAASLGYTPSLNQTAAAGLGANITNVNGCSGGAQNARVDVEYSFSFITPVAILGLTNSSVNVTGRGVMPCRA
jgi:Flp pilus assembly protein TadG